MSYPRRRQLRHLLAAVALGAGATALLAGAVAVWAQGLDGPGALLGALAAALGWRCRGAVRAAERNRIGSESEAQVARALAALRSDGRRVPHAVDWPGPGDIDHVVRGPTVTFAVETKTARYTPAHLRRVHDQARWLGRRRRAKTIAVLVVCRAHGPARFEDGVVVVGVERLVDTLRELERSAGPGR